ncbi:hypothetical protein LTS18_001568 [Coniosporium uncinatum]|uniref:Uncharacterized protein n=1 Tax=Coniosporium uncinatum TaxID=93489 RepID=A0ACC3DUP8_9PEZI|nr:hypothetical protein LTS18_001568 [Coniosporium uncinatum]
MPYTADMKYTDTEPTLKVAIGMIVARGQLQYPIGENGAPFGDPAHPLPSLHVPPNAALQDYHNRSNNPQLLATSGAQVYFRSIKTYYGLDTTGAGTDFFGPCRPQNRQRLVAVEEHQAIGMPIRRIEVAFWRACWERTNNPETFSFREEYIKMEVAVRHWSVEVLELSPSTTVSEMAAILADWLEILPSDEREAVEDMGRKLGGVRLEDKEESDEMVDEMIMG